MTPSLEALDEQFSWIRFNGDCAEYRAFLQKILAIHDPDRRANLEFYYEILTKVLEALFYEDCGGTLSAAEKVAIFALIRADWHDNGPDGFRASVLSLLGMLQPLAGVSEWLLLVADRQDDPIYADALRGCAACPRIEPAV